MHELSIAHALIDAAIQAAPESHILTVNIRVGPMAGVAPDALLFCFAVAAESTPCSQAKLVIEEAPLTVFCPKCQEAKALDPFYNLSCPTCASPTPQILTGQELDLVSVEVESVESDKAADHDATCA